MEMKTNCKYVMIVTSEDDRYTGNADGLQLGHWVNNPWTEHSKALQQAIRVRICSKNWIVKDCFTNCLTHSAVRD